MNSNKYSMCLRYLLVFIVLFLASCNSVALIPNNALDDELFIDYSEVNTYDFITFSNAYLYDREYLRARKTTCPIKNQLLPHTDLTIEEALENTYLRTLYVDRIYMHTGTFRNSSYMYIFSLPKKSHYIQALSLKELSETSLDSSDVNSFFPTIAHVDSFKSFPFFLLANAKEITLDSLVLEGGTSDSLIFSNYDSPAESIGFRNICHKIKLDKKVKDRNKRDSLLLSAFIDKTGYKPKSIQVEPSQ